MGVKVKIYYQVAGNETVFYTTYDTDSQGRKRLYSVHYNTNASWYQLSIGYGDNIIVTRKDATIEALFTDLQLNYSTLGSWYIVKNQNTIVFNSHLNIGVVLNMIEGALSGSFSSGFSNGFA